MEREDLLSYLERNDIAYHRLDHEPVFTCEAAKRVMDGQKGLGTKNLFLRDGPGKKHYLVAVSDEVRVDLNKLAAAVEIKKPSFASPERLKRYLDLEPGSVTLLGVINDKENAVEVILDEEVASAEAIQCHPLVNTSSLVVGQEGIRKFLQLTGHVPRIMRVPRAE
jgi:Ala-tRNA(Pro) deacylase